MVRVFVADVSALPDPATEKGALERVSFERRERILRLVSGSARKERLGAELLLAVVLPRFDRAPSQIVLGAHGKPLLPKGYFSLSHSEGAVALALSDSPVGCDIERLRKAPVRVAERKFTERERGTLSFEYDDSFFRIWTAKESYLKLTGEGLSALSRVEVDLPNGRILRNGIRMNCFLREYDYAGYALTVCAEEENFAELEKESLSI